MIKIGSCIRGRFSNGVVLCFMCNDVLFKWQFMTPGNDPKELKAAVHLWEYSSYKIVAKVQLLSVLKANKLDEMSMTSTESVDDNPLQQKP